MMYSTYLVLRNVIGCFSESKQVEKPDNDIEAVAAEGDANDSGEITDMIRLKINNQTPVPFSCVWTRSWYIESMQNCYHPRIYLLTLFCYKWFILIN